MTAEHVATIVGGRRSGAGWEAKCPAHEDRKASLSIGSGDEGRVLLKCHAGCQVDQILARLNLTAADLFPDDRKPARREVAAYDYRDKSGALRYQVVRFEPKDFRQRRPDGSGGWIWNLTDVPRLLYRLPELAGHLDVAIVEGEKDADRLWAAGIAATTNVGGAEKWRESYAQQLADLGVTRAWVIPDNDEPGRKHAAKVAYSCQIVGIQATVIELPGVPPKGDVSDYLNAHSPAAFVALIEAAKPVPVVSPWFDVEAQLATRRAEVVEAQEGRRIALGLPALDATIGGIRRGEVCGLMARPGTGKTLLLGHFAHHVATTTDLAHVFFSLEMPASQIVGRLQQRLYGFERSELEQVDYSGRLDVQQYRETFQRLLVVDRGGLDVAAMGRLVDQMVEGPLRGVTLGLVTIDHLGLIGGDRKLTTYDRVSLQAREIKELAKRLQCAVLLAVQPNRDSGGDGSKELGLGSARDSGVVEEAMDYLIGMRRLDRSLTLAPRERERFTGVLFAKVIKNRHGEPGVREVAYHCVGRGLRPVEDPHLVAESEDVVERIAQMRPGGYRR